jgi:hypothetical protein
MGYGGVFRNEAVAVLIYFHREVFVRRFSQPEHTLTPNAISDFGAHGGVRSCRRPGARSTAMFHTRISIMVRLLLSSCSKVQVEVDSGQLVVALALQVY